MSIRFIASLFLTIGLMAGSCAPAQASSRAYYGVMGGLAAIGAVCGYVACRYPIQAWNTLKKTVENGWPCRFTHIDPKRLGISDKEIAQLNIDAQNYNKALPGVLNATPGVIPNSAALADGTLDKNHGLLLDRLNSITKQPNALYKTLRNTALFTGSFAAALGLRALLLTKWRKS